MRHRPLFWAVLLCFALVIVGCGKKGPPRLIEPKKPGAPANVTAIRRAGEVTLRWDRRGSAKEYQISRLDQTGELKTETSIEPLFIDLSGSDRHSYVYTVVAFSEDGVPSELSAPVELDALPVFSAPQGLRAEITNEGVRFTWGYLAGLPIRFNVFRATGDYPYTLTPANAGHIGTTSYDDTPTLDAAVRYVVRPVRYSERSVVRYEGPMSNEVIVSPSNYVPSRVTGLKAFPKGKDIVVMWNENPEKWIRTYEILRVGIEGDFSVVGSAQIPAFTDTTWIGGEVLYKVQAVGPGGAGPLSDPVRVNPD